MPILHQHMITQLVQKIKAITGYSLLQLLPSISNLLLSVVIVRWFKVEYWGQIVSLQLIYYVAGAVINWGNKEHLLKLFANQPQQINQLWNEHFWTRIFCLLLPACLGLFFYYHNTSALHLCIWIGARYVAQSFEAIIVHQKKYTQAIVAEMLSIGVLLLWLFVFKSAMPFHQVLWAITFSNVFKAVWVFWAYSPKLSISPPQVGLFKHAFGFFMLGFVMILYAKTDQMLVAAMLDEAALGKYQVVSNYFSLIKAAASFVVYPFAIELYQMNKQDLLKATQKVFLIGILLTLIALVAMYVFLLPLYQIEADWLWSVFGFMACVPVFVTTPLHIYFFRFAQAKVVIGLMGATIVFSALLAYMFIPTYQLNGAFFGMAIAQLLVLPFYIWCVKKIKV